ncbi:CRAL/TRIO domain-containing protein [Trametes polyzona]|nr:CRAL/TRIO domain-containing protein [Trametes polyzona]
MAPSQDKAAVLKQFREELANQNLIHDGDTIGTDDETLLRFLRARQFNLKQATLMWKNCQHWRQTVEGVGIDELYRQIDPFDYPERDHVFDCWPLYFHKTDKKGRPLNFHHFGGINLNKLQKKMTLERFWQTVIVNCEALTREVLPAAAEAAGKPILGTFVVVDLSGFGISQFWQMKDFARSSFQVSQDYFPETMAQLAIVNAPMGFSTIWNVMKPWLAKETVAKVAIYGSDYRKALLELIDPDALPASLGGTCTCAGQGGCMKSNAGPWMHERAKRREAWLRGERETMALLPGELHGEVRVGKKQPEAQAQAQAAPQESQPQAEVPSPAPEEAAHASGSTSEASSIATPSSNAARSREASVERVLKEHPETREVQTGDLHNESTIMAAAR